MFEQTILKKYVRNKDRSRRGVIVATMNGTGWSLCCRKDKYDNEIALKIAVNRANYCGNKTLKIPAQLAGIISEMDLRRRKYFKI